MAYNVRQKNGNARRKLRARIKAENRECAICGQPIDYDLPAGDAYSFELDEIIPVSKGGSPIEYNNVQPTHRICNQKKGNKIYYNLSNNQKDKNTDDRIVTSKNWRDI